MQIQVPCMLYLDVSVVSDPFCICRQQPCVVWSLAFIACAQFWARCDSPLSLVDPAEHRAWEQWEYNGKMGSGSSVLPNQAGSGQSSWMGLVFWTGMCTSDQQHRGCFLIFVASLHSASFVVCSHGVWARCGTKHGKARAFVVDL